MSTVIKSGTIVAADQTFEDQPRPGPGRLVRREPFPAVNQALSKWKKFAAPRAVTRSPERMPIGV